MPDLYCNEKKQPLEASFAAPGAVFRGAPFWSWNTRLDPETLVRQIDTFKEMGIGGFHMHSRVGLANEYLGTEFMDCVKACVEKARKENMLAWLYDEDRWPSGAAGGLVTKHPEYRQRKLVFLPDRLAEGEKKEQLADGVYLASYAVKLHDGYLASYRLRERGAPVAEGETAWSLYRVLHDCNSWYNNQTYLDTLNPKAVEKFVEVTHEAYKREVGKDFGGVVPAIFTDEPNYGWNNTLGTPEEERWIEFPYTDDFPATYREAYGAEFFATFPEIVWELPEAKASLARYRFLDHLTERFACAFADTIGNWCGKNGLSFTGHMLEEVHLQSQTRVIGEAMRHYRSFQLPGIDMLCDAHEYTTAKQAQSAVHQFARSGVLSELYGVTGWDFDFAGHKSQGDWQAALGVTVRVHHLSWVSMKGEAKRDYPASIFHQSPWYKRYRVVEDHFARVNAALVRGTPRVRIGLLHPIESFWLSYGVMSQTAIDRKQQEDNFLNACDWLLLGQLDFDYLCESLLPQQCSLSWLEPGKGFTVGAMAYDVVVVPPMRTMRSTTLERLEAFVNAGGRVIFAGEIPSLLDAQPSSRPAALAARCTCVSFTRPALLEALEPVREVFVTQYNDDPWDGTIFDHLVYQMRQEGPDRILFLSCVEREGHVHGCHVSVKGEWAVELLDTYTGEITPLAAEYAKGMTTIVNTFFPHSHLLLRLKPGRRTQGKTLDRQIRVYREEEMLGRLPDRMPVTLSEPNALLLDQAQWRIADGEWQPKDELLRVCNHARNALGINKAGGFSGHMAQPWVTPPDATVYGVVELRFAIESSVAVRGAMLAAELADNEEIYFDGKPVTAAPAGWWVDEAIRTVALPDFAAGAHELLLRIPLKRAFSIEWCYLLGDFGVQVAGRSATLCAPVRELAFGDIVGQGLPFYTGNIVYHCRAAVTAENAVLSIPQFAGALVDVSVDGRAQEPIAFAPYRCHLQGVQPGEHAIDLTLYGTRENAFGPLHWATPGNWVGPHAWRTGGEEWCYEYRLKPAGILSAPALCVR